MNKKIFPIRPTRIQLSKKWSLFIDDFGCGFANGIVIIPTLTINFKSGYYQFTISWLKMSYDFTFNKYEQNAN